MGCLACRPEKTVETQLRAYFLMVEEHYRMALSDGLAAGVASVLYPMPRNPLHNWQELRQSDDDEAAPKMLAALEGALEDYLRQHAPKNANRDSPLGLGIYTPDGPIREKDALGFVAEFVSVLAQCPKAVTGLLAYEELSGELEHLRRHAREGPISETERALCRLLRKQEVCPDELRARLAPVLTEVRLKYRGMHGKFAGSDWLGCITSAVSAIQSRAEGLLCRRDVVLALCPLGDLRTHLHFLNVLGMRVRGDSAVCRAGRCPQRRGRRRRLRERPARGARAEREPLELALQQHARAPSVRCVRRLCGGHDVDLPSVSGLRPVRRVPRRAPPQPRRRPDRDPQRHNMDCQPGRASREHALPRVPDGDHPVAFPEPIRGLWI
eukprot:TRINITY_DN9398_c0_g1_i2.p1 TRINITY_DN9398_c0_g1~~TRINITY_DN9398_c0_g1_i2.p1  ORF type:complete len:382 (+),score=66.13 TRINITY_DN9398_c0_g1_i2:93-1238(+)